MAALLSAAFFLLAVVGRVFIQLRRTGNHGIRFANPATDPIAAIADAISSLSFTLSIIVIAHGFGHLNIGIQWNTFPGSRYQSGCSESA